MTIRFLLLTVIIFLMPMTSVRAGLLGPSNYEECVLDKMKGQDKSLLSTARTACRNAFPAEPTESVIANDRIKYTWCKSEYDAVAACIDKAPPNIKITKIEGLFFEEGCDKEQSKPGVTGIAKKPWYGSTYKFDLPPAPRGCAIFTFYGIEE